MSTPLLSTSSSGVRSSPRQRSLAMNKAEAEYLETLAAVCVRRLFYLRQMPEARYAIREWITDLRRARAYLHPCS